MPNNLNGIKEGILFLSSQGWQKVAGTYGGHLVQLLLKQGHLQQFAHPLVLMDLFFHSIIPVIFDPFFCIFTDHLEKKKILWEAKGLERCLDFWPK